MDSNDGRPFDRDELERRNLQAIEAAAGQALDGLLVWSRAGGTLERHANVQYLTGFATSFPTVGDLPGYWRDRGYSCCLILPGPRTILFVDVPGGAESAGFAYEVLQVDDLVGSVADVLTRLRLAGARIGLVGSDVMTTGQHSRLRAALPSVLWTDADAILAQARLIKSPSEQAVLRSTAAVGLAAAQAAMGSVQAGRTAAEVVSSAGATAIARGALLYNMFADVYGPTRRGERNLQPPYVDSQPLADGDMFCLDMTGAQHGYMWDLSRSAPVGDGHPKNIEMLELAKQAVYAVIRGLVPGNTGGQAARAGFELLASAGQPAGGGRREFNALGHGLGMSFEDPWLFGSDETVLQAGMCICVERACTEGPFGAVWEEMVLVTENGPEVLTKNLERPS